MSAVREEVMAELISAAKEAIAAGLFAPDELQRRFTGLPESVAYDAWMTAERASNAKAEDAWWDKIERTIDGEVIRKAIGGEV